MRNYSKIFLVLKMGAIFLSLTFGSVLAETVEKYSIVATADGFVRTNTETGHTSLCVLTNKQLICRASVDETMAFEESNQKLRDRISTLERKIAKIEKDSKYSFDLSNSEEVDKAMDMMEGFMTRFFDMAKSLNRDDKG